VFTAVRKGVAGPKAEAVARRRAKTAANFNIFGVVTTDATDGDVT
jgi:hypothetical protein